LPGSGIGCQVERWPGRAAGRRLRNLFFAPPRPHTLPPAPPAEVPLSWLESRFHESWFLEKLGYAWSHLDGQNDERTRFVAVLEIPPVVSAETAVRVQTVKNVKKGKL
jgi:hypothetical protein